MGRVLVSADTFGVSAVVLRESRRRAETGDARSKLRTSRHADRHLTRLIRRLPLAGLTWHLDGALI